MPLLPKQSQRKNFQRRTGNRIQIVRDTYGKDWFERKKKLDKVQPTCEHPGCNKPVTDDHHIQRLSHGGKSVGINQLRLCDQHHQMRHAHHKLDKTKRFGR